MIADDVESGSWYMCGSMFFRAEKIRTGDATEKYAKEIGRSFVELNEALSEAIGWLCTEENFFRLWTVPISRLTAISGDDRSKAEQAFQIFEAAW